MTRRFLLLLTIVFGCVVLVNNSTSNDSTSKPKSVEGRFIKSGVVEHYFKWVPEELRGGLYRPPEPEGNTEKGGVFYAKNTLLAYSLSDWTQLEFDQDKANISEMRIFGFARINSGKRIDASISDDNLLRDVKKAIDYTNVFRPCVSDLGNGLNRAPGALILGVIQLKFDGDRMPIIIGVSSNHFTLGACYGPSSQLFFAPRFTQVLDTVLRQYTEKQNGLPPKAFWHLQGKGYFETSFETSKDTCPSRIIHPKDKEQESSSE